MEAQDEGHNNDAGPSSPRYAPLSSASLFPPPPPTHIHFTPLNLWLHKVLNEHWDDSLLAQQESNDDGASSSLSPRMQLQRTLLLQHAPNALSKAPADVASQHDAASLREYITSSLCIDLKLEMDPPDLSVITHTARGYNLYGQWWPVPSLLPGLKEAGIQRLYPDDEDADAHRDEEGRIDRRPSLLLLLRSFMATYLKLLSLLQYPPSYYSLRTFARDTLQEEGGEGDAPTNTNGNGNGHAHAPEGDAGEIQWQTTTSAQWSHLRTLVLNFQEVLNRARPHQAAVNLERLVEEQLREKRRKTRELREKCRGVREMIARWEGEGRGKEGREGGMGVKRQHEGKTEEMDVDVGGVDAQGTGG